MHGFARAVLLLALGWVVYSVVSEPIETPAAAPTETPPAPTAVSDSGRAQLVEKALDAAREGDMDTLREVFAAGLDGSVQSPRGDSLLTLAAYYGHADAVRLILEQDGTEPNAVNVLGATALAGASYRGHVDAVKALIAGGASVDAANAAGQTPLMFAAMFNKGEIVRILLEAGADPNHRDQSGATAISLAEQQGHDEIAALLIKVGQ